MIAEKKSFRKACLIKEKDVIFALPNRKDLVFIARLEGFKTAEFLGRIFFFKKACRLKKKLYFCSRFKNESLVVELKIE